MIGKSELSKFKKMWKWLTTNPELNRNYYMKRVLQQDKVLINKCPLCNSKQLEKCSGCKELWDCTHGNLCTDPDSPLYKWKNTLRSQPEKRAFHAGQIVELAKKYRNKPGQQTRRWSSHRKTALGEPLPTTHRRQWIAW